MYIISYNATDEIKRDIRCFTRNREKVQFLISTAEKNSTRFVPFPREKLLFFLACLGNNVAK